MAVVVLELDEVGCNKQSIKKINTAKFNIFIVVI
jgi:hypothetical protein